MSKDHCSGVDFIIRKHSLRTPEGSKVEAQDDYRIDGTGAACFTDRYSGQILNSDQ